MRAIIEGEPSSSSRSARRSGRSAGAGRAPAAPGAAAPTGVLNSSGTSAAVRWPPEKGGLLVTAERITSERDRSEVVVSAAIRSSVDLPERMWFAVPARFDGDVAVDGDPFLPVLAIVGMGHHVPIEMPEVSTELLDGCTRIMEIYDGVEHRARR